MNVIANNLQTILTSFKSVRKMAECIGISHTTLNEYLKGRTPPADFIVRICERLEINFDWLLTNHGTMHRKSTIKATYEASEDENIDEFAHDNDVVIYGAQNGTAEADLVYVPLLDEVKAGAGTGFIVENESSSREICFQRAWMLRHGISTKNVSIIYVSGDSMFPTILNGDMLLVDHLQISPIGDRIYVVRTGDGVVVKRCGGVKENILTLRSDNPVIHEFTVDLASPDIAVIGRVVWFGRII